MNIAFFILALPIKFSLFTGVIEIKLHLMLPHILRALGIVINLTIFSEFKDPVAATAETLHFPKAAFTKSMTAGFIYVFILVINFLVIFPEREIAIIIINFCFWWVIDHKFIWIQVKTSLVVYRDLVDVFLNLAEGVPATVKELTPILRIATFC